MAEPWLSIIGVGEDGLDGVSRLGRDALDAAAVIYGGARHLALVGAGARGRSWPVPFRLDPLMREAARPVAVVASGDPFWHGVGRLIAAALPRGAWRAYPAPSTLSLAAARLGLPAEAITTLPLHHAPLATLRAALAPGQPLLLLVADPTAVQSVAGWIAAEGWGASTMHILEALGGPRERIRTLRADGDIPGDVLAPVSMLVEPAGGPVLPFGGQLPDAAFHHDGTITKAPLRALALSALGPQPGGLLWDVGAGSGTVAVAWCLAAPGARALAVEARSDRLALIAANGERFGLACRLEPVAGHAPEALASLPAPQAVFVGGGASAELLAALWDRLPAGVRLVAHGVTLATEALLISSHERLGGSLHRFAVAEALPLGNGHGWQPARPIVQWRVVR